MIISESAARGVLPLLELESLNDLTEDAVRDAYKTVAKKTHPDVGGNAAAFANADRAKHLLLQWLNQRATAKPATAGLQKYDCHQCDGTGRKRVHHGFKSMTMVCGTCHGTGDAEFQPDKTGD